MTKFVFVNDNTEIYQSEGTYHVGNGAYVDYKFDTDGTVKICIPAKWFSPGSIVKVKDFLTALEDELNRRISNS